MFPTEGPSRVSSLFSARRPPAARLRTAYRRYRATPRHGLAGPVLLALAIAGVGHQVAASADADAVPTLSGARSVAMLRNDPMTALLGEPLAPATSLRARALYFRGTALTAPERASRTAVRTPVAKPKPKPKARAPRWFRPSGGPLTSPYGMRWGRMHRGLDFGAGYGSPIRAAFDGVIIAAGYENGYGKQIRIRHAGGVVTSYSHMSSFVRTGGRVQAGDVIGKVGSTGSSTGPHLHFEVLVGGANVNPRPFLKAHGIRV